ncbi:MAG: SURF1 family protein [Alphaproteobacteria bacterium]|nr:SURF1 family protein [Alphaproteobacteria bacterium]
MKGAFSFRPTLWPTLLTVPAVLVLIALGTWQMDRLAWKRALIAEAEANLAEPPVTLPARIETPETWELRRVQVRGRFLHEKEMYLTSRTRNGHVGFGIVTPFLREDGRALLVHRGWVPMDRKDPATRADGLSSGAVAIEGVLRTDKPKGWLTPANEPENNLWFHVDLPAMAAFAGVTPVVPLLLEAAPDSDPGVYPVADPPRIELADNHLSYATIWYSLAAGLLVIYFLYHRRTRP